MHIHESESAETQKDRKNSKRDLLRRLNKTREELKVVETETDEEESDSATMTEGEKNEDHKDSVSTDLPCEISRSEK